MCFPTVVFVEVEDEIVGAVALSDILRQESYEAVRKLKGIGIKCMMLELTEADVGIAIGVGTDFWSSSYVFKHCHCVYKCKIIETE